VDMCPELRTVSKAALGSPIDPSRSHKGKPVVRRGRKARGLT